MTIHFKNKEVILVDEKIANIIKNRILEGCSKFQSFTNEKGELILIVNIEEITYID
jgi:hypothetical protein